MVTSPLFITISRFPDHSVPGGIEDILDWEAMMRCDMQGWADICIGTRLRIQKLVALENYNVGIELNHTTGSWPRGLLYPHVLDVLRTICSEDSNPVTYESRK